MGTGLRFLPYEARIISVKPTTPTNQLTNPVDLVVRIGVFSAPFSIAGIQQPTLRSQAQLIFPVASFADPEAIRQVLDKMRDMVLRQMLADGVSISDVLQVLNVTIGSTAMSEVAVDPPS